MLTRREILVGAVAAGAVMRARTGLANASQPATAVNFDVPAGACDCHTHIHGDPETFPFFSGRVYTPEMALPEEMAALHAALRMQRVVIVTPSVYGTDTKGSGSYTTFPPDPLVRGEGSRACRSYSKRGALPAGPTERGGPPPLSNSPRGLCGLDWTVV